MYLDLPTPGNQNKAKDKKKNETLSNHNSDGNKGEG